MYNLQNLKRLYILCIALIMSLSAVCMGQTRQRNTIYVLDCTGSMGGYKGSPDIWAPTKKFLKSELEKEAKENPGARVTLLPFQEKVLHPIVVDLDNIAWPKLESVLNGYIERVTDTNICDSWLAAERYIDPSCDNYIVLMTDGHDNIGGSGNEANRTALVGQILRDFCGKYQNTKGFYVELTQAASLPADIQKAIINCDDLYKIDATDGIPLFGCASEDEININTRDLPTDVTLGFSNSGTFAATIASSENPYVTFSIKDNKISHGKVTLHIESKYGDEIEALNKAINAPGVELTVEVESDDVNITNPTLDVILHTTPLRTLDLTGGDIRAERTKPFPWIKGNPADTMSWDLKPVFKAETPNSFAMFRLRSDRNMTPYSVLFNGADLSKDSIVIIRPGEGAVLDVIVPADEKDAEFNMTLNEVNANDLDRLNGVPCHNFKLDLKGSIDTKMSLVEILFWSVLTLIAIFLLAWFGIIRNQKYPKFRKGIITIQNPYFATLRVRGYRKIVFDPKNGKQSVFDRIWRGKILYHANPVWPCEAEITPSGRNMRFRCASGSLICTPQPLVTPGSTFEILNPSVPALKIKISIG